MLCELVTEEESTRKYLGRSLSLRLGYAGTPGRHKIPVDILYLPVQRSDMSKLPYHLCGPQHTKATMTGSLGNCSCSYK